ncbi:MAG: iron uptake porin [Cyanobacteria bacterium RI_101]|nr:iron uptake porin [Cyanobacteria bacterium RI_101]
MFSFPRAVFSLAVFSLAWLPSAVFGEAPKPRYKTFQDGTFQPRVADLQAPGVSQVSSVSELRDVQPNEWAYEALKSLVERYGCIVGYPDQTFRGNRALSRWEFAAGLNACLNTLERLIQENVTVLQADLEKLKTLAQQFEQELSQLGARLDNLESRVAYLEDHQFSTTTKLNGDVIMVYSGVWGAEQADGPPDQSIQNGQPTVSYRSRMNWDTSFTGQDQLRVRIQTANFFLARGGSNLTDFNFTVASEPLTPQVNKLQYRFPVTEQLTAWINGAKITLDDVADPLAPFASSFTEGALSFFGAISPIYLASDNTGPGGGLAYQFTPELSLGAFYSAGNGFKTESGNGLFNGQFVTGAQLTYLPSADTGVGIAYTRQYIPQNQFSRFAVLGFTGLANADNPFSFANRENFGDGNATSSDNVALIWTWRLAPGLSLEGWGMYTSAWAEGGERAGDSADIWNWKVSLAFPDLFKEGNLGMISVGQPPYAARISNNNDLPDITPATTDTPWFVESFYVFQINPSISLTPGLWVGINPANDRAPLWVWALRTSYKF